MTLCNNRQNRRNGINPTNENTIACNEANASIVNCSTSGAVAPVVSRRATTTTTLSTFSSAKLIVNYPLSIVHCKLSIVNCTLLIVLCCLLFGGKAFAQTTIKMGADGTDHVFPFNNFYKNSWNQMIYTAEELGGAQTISTISFLIGGVPSTNWSATNLKVYMGHTSLCGNSGTEDLSTTSWVPSSSLTQVYSSASYTPTTVTTYTDFAQNWWVTISLSSSFSYNGTDNLAIVVAQQCSTYQSGLTFKYITDAHYQCLYRRNDNDTGYASHPGTNSGTQSKNRPILKLTASGTVGNVINIKKTSVAMGQEYYFVDEGGDGGDCSNGDAANNYYTRAAQFRHVFTAPAGAAITASFSSLCTESCCDNLNIYNGNSTSSTALATNLTTTPSGTYSSTGQSMTFMFKTDGSVNRAGFKTNISCVAACISRTLSFASGSNQVAMGSTISRPAVPSAGGGNVTYTSSNTSVATVNSSGVITGVTVGSATITATIPANGDYCEATQIYTVSVVAPTPVITQTTPLPQCGIADAVLTASLPGGVAVPSGYTYHWYSNSACTTEITSGVSGTNNNTLTYPIAANTIVYCRLERRVAVNNVQEQTFTYNGGIQTYTVPDGATELQLEVWGAQGGSYSSSYSGGLGGYSKGTLNSPTAGSTLYVVVGGQGGTNTATPTTGGDQITGGYNGGGNSVVHYWSSSWSLPQAGGGATHIATVTGVLSSLSSQQDKVLIVAGGGSGGVYSYDGSTYRGFTGYGGGGPTSTAYSSTYQATQTTAGTGGSFGQGASYTGKTNYKFGPSGGGGGWYGGGNRQDAQDTYAEELVRGHGGGSGYIKSTLTSTSSSNGYRSGHGQAKITATIPAIEIANSSSAVSYSVECTNCDDPAGTYAISGSATQSIGTGQNLTLTVNNTTGYTIAWESANSSIVTVSGSGNSATITGVSLGNTTVTATITPSDVSICPKTLIYTITVKPTITFDISTNCSGTASGQPEPQTVTVGTNVTVPWGGITCSDGKTFVGWNASSDGTGHAYREGDQVQVMQNTTLYAIFMADPCDNIVDMQVGVDYEGILGDLGLWDTHNATCTWDEPGEERVYSFTPYKTGTHIFTFSTTDGDPDFYISTSCSNTIATLYCADADPDEQYEMDLTRGITYYVIVDNADEDGSAEYLVRVDVLDPSGGVNSPCGTTIIYCSTSGNDGNDGGSTSPVKTLSQALTLANSVSPTADNPAIIRMASGTYNVNAPVNLISNVIIDGQWTANTTTGVWTKGTTLTTINRTATSPEGGTTMPRITAIEGNNKSNFKLQDIKVTTATAPAYSSISGNNYGVSTYAVHLNGCSGYEFVRCRLQPGNASAGKNGTNGSTGASGGSGSNGSSGSSNTAYSGGAGGTNSSCSSANGYSGGAGGRDYSRGSQGGGSGGAGGNVESSGSNGSAGSTGSAGTSYSGQRASVNNTSTYYGEYFKGTQARTGGNGGYGTGGRGGGGGGGTDATASWCERGGGGGGGGGAGGCGGTGGTGGYSGGSSFGVYHYGSTSLGTFTDCNIVSGTSGSGGSGGSGGAGGTGGSGGSGGSGGTSGGFMCTASSGSGGAGGKGGNGGTGGAGESGANGVSYKIAIVTTAGVCTPTTSGYTTTPNNYITSIDYGSSSKQGCTNSQISLSKTSGSWASGQYGTLINDKNSTTSSYTSSSASIITGYDATGTYRPVSNGPQIFITQSRSLGEISGEDAFCNGATAEYTYDGDYISQGDVLQWRLVSSDGNTLYYAHAEMAASNGDESGTKFIINTESLNLDAGIYYVKLEVKSDCCGVSIPIWKQITINDTPTGVIALSGTSPVCYNGSTTVSLTFTGAAPFDYELSDGTSGTTYDNPATVTLSSITADNTYYITSLTDNTGCSAIASDLTGSATVTVLPVMSADITAPISGICIGTTTTLTVSNITGVGPYSYQWQKSPNGTDSWSNITGANAATYNAPISEAGHTYYRVNITDNGNTSDCNTLTKETDVVVWPELSADITAPISGICIGTTTALTVSNLNGVGTYSYQWQKSPNGTDSWSNITGANAATYNAPISEAGHTYYRVNITDNGRTSGCNTLTKETDVNVYPAFTAGTIASTGETICKDATPTEIGSTTAATGGDGNIHYQWYVGSTAIDGETNATFTPSDYAGTVGTYTFTRKAKDESCNSTLIPSEGSWILTVEEASVGTVTASADPSAICVGKSATLSASATGNSGAMSYVWSSGSTSVTPNATTTYNVTATATTAVAGCTAETVKEVTVTVTAPSVDGIASGDMVWSGNAGTTNWTTAGNWLTYGGSDYSVAASVPSASTNVFLATYGECVTSNPALTAAAATKNLNIGSGRALSLGSYTLSVAGNLTNNGTFNAGTGTVVFNGSTPQTISGTSLTFNNVTFNNTKNFTLDELTPTVSGTANFTAGIVTGDMNFGASATTANASRASYVEGKVTKVAGSSEFTFPTGNAGVFGSVTATPTANTWVRFHNLVASGDALPADYPRFWNPNDNCDDNNPRLDHVSNYEYWDINSPAGLSGATIVSSADNADKHFGSTEPAPTASDVFGAIWTGSCWSNIGGSNQTISADNKTIMIEGVDIPAVTRAGTPYFTLGSKDHETLLPIELVSFTADCDGRSSLVEWTTATEKNNDYFSLERSDDAVNFTEIARVAGAGNSIEPIDYAYTDYGIHGGDNYYRLVQVDYDGTRTVSEIVVANCIESDVDEPEVQAYPNPFNGELTLVLDNFDNRPATIEVYDMLGKLIYMQKADAPQNSYETILNLSNLPTGAYNVRVSTADFVINRQIVKN